MGTQLHKKQSRTWPHPGLRVLGEEVGAEAVLQSRPNEIRITLIEEEARPPLTRLRPRDLTEFDGGLVLLRSLRHQSVERWLRVVLPGATLRRRKWSSETGLQRRPRLDRAWC